MFVEAAVRAARRHWAEGHEGGSEAVAAKPESEFAFGREAYAKRLEGALKTGFRDYSAKVKEAHLVGSDRAWTTGSYTFTVNDKDGQPEQARGNWVDMLRREGNAWKVSFQAYARTAYS